MKPLFALGAFSTLLIVTTTLATPVPPPAPIPPPTPLLVPSRSTTTNPSLSPTEYLTLRILLLLTHLHHNLFIHACALFTEADFVSAGFGSGMLKNVCEMGVREWEHVKAVDAVVRLYGVEEGGGDGGGEFANAVDQCSWTFGFEDPRSFVDVAVEVVGMGIAGWRGGGESFGNCSSLLQLATSILPVVSAYDAFLRAAYGATPFPTSFDASLPPIWTYKLAEQYMLSCPVAAHLPIATPPKLNATAPYWRDNLEPDPNGIQVAFEWEPSQFYVNVSCDQPLYIAVVHQEAASELIFVNLDANRTEDEVPKEGVAIIPMDASEGVIFAALTTFAGNLSMSELVEFGTLAGPVEIVMS